jgi:hypothetical protein
MTDQMQLMMTNLQEMSKRVESMETK